MLQQLELHEVYLMFMIHISKLLLHCLKKPVWRKKKKKQVWQTMFLNLKLIFNIKFILQLKGAYLPANKT